MFRQAVVSGTVVAVIGGMGASLAPESAAATPRTTTTNASTASTCSAARLAVSTPLERKIGQLFMVGNPATAASSTVKSYIATYHVGNVFLSGRSSSGVAHTASVTASLRSAVNSTSTQNVQLFVATDQEGGYVQVLKGSGFSTMPTALAQGKNPGIYYSAQSWARQLRSAGVNMNLAPVADTVPSWLGRGNPPIGYWYRQYGYDSATVGTYSNAFAWGMRAGGVAPTVKHFPGLGLVRANTDDTANVHDRWMTVNGNYSTYLNPFRRAAAAGVPFTMMSSAIYDNIDRSRPAVFSPTVVSVLRNNVGFKGIIMTDDIGSAAAMSPWSYASRAVNTINAGGQLILTVTPAAIPAMYDALLANAHASSAFTYKINAAAFAMFRAKQSYGLLPATC